MTDSGSSPGSSGSPKEILDVFLFPDVGLDLKVDYPKDTEGSAGRFVVTGPKRKVDILRYVAEGIDDDGEIDGVISPMSPVTLPLEIKREVGIPDAATLFAFVYPLQYFKRRLHRINLATEPWGFAHLLGAFAYFDDDRTLLGVNALTIVPQQTVLHLVGPHKPLSVAVAAMNDLGRMAEVVVDGLLDAGFQQFGWVHPGEMPGGHELLDTISNDHGGFLFETAEGPAFFVLDPTPQDDTGFVEGSLGNAMVGLRVALIEGDAINRGKSLSREAHRIFVRTTAEATIVLILYLAVGTSVLLLFDPNFDDTRDDFVEQSIGARILDGVYFCIVTMSTVGYGDLHPALPGTRLFNILLIFFGVVLLFPRLAAVLGLMTKPYVVWGRKKINYWIPNTAERKANGKSTSWFRKQSVVVVPPKPVIAPAASPLKPGLKKQATAHMSTDKLAIERGSFKNKDGTWLPLPGWIFYSKNLFPSIFLFMLFQCLFALGFCYVEQWDFELAFYHCIVTATTVGYGYPILGQNISKKPEMLTLSRIFSSTHILVSVAFLADIINIADELRDERKKELTRLAALNRKLDQKLLDNLNMTATRMRPEAQVHADGITELEFVIGMVVELGMVDMEQVRVLLCCLLAHTHFLHPLSLSRLRMHAALPLLPCTRAGDALHQKVPRARHRRQRSPRHGRFEAADKQRGDNERAHRHGVEAMRQPAEDR